MKRVFAITILVLTMASLMVGCGETHQEQSSTDLASKEDNLPLVEEEKDDISSEERALETESAAEPSQCHLDKLPMSLKNLKCYKTEMNNSLFFCAKTLDKCSKK